MLKRLSYLIVLAGILCTWPLASGCHRHSETVERTSTYESEPQMVSPGKEKLE